MLSGVRIFSGRKDAFQSDVEGQAVVEMSVGTDGRVLATRILESSSDPDFDDKVLKYYMKQRYIPALDENGTPIEGIACQRFHHRAAQPVKMSTIENLQTPSVRCIADGRSKFAPSRQANDLRGARLLTHEAGK